MKQIFFFLLILPAFSYAQVNPGDITIARDSFGVPHIFGKSDADAAYGLAWAHAEDNFRDIQYVLLTGKGMLGKAIGKKGAEADYVVALLRCRDVVEEKFNSLSPEFMKVVEGYVAGLNAYAKKHPGEVLLKKAFPATTKDYLTAVTFSLCIISGIDRQLPDLLSGKVTSLDGFVQGGSNGFAIHPSRTTTGEAFLAINSHQPLEGPVAWYEAHIQSEEGWNIIGGLFPGGLCAFLGVNEHLGWAHTVNMMDKIDIFQLHMNADNSAYEFDGNWIPLEKRKVKLSIKGIPVKISKPLYWSRYGATIKNAKGFYSIRLTANQDIRAIEQWWRMNKAKNFTEFYNALSMQGLSMFNIIYADRYDTIFYMSGGKMPLRNKDPKYHWKDVVPGNSSATLWKEFHPIKDLPQLINPPMGYVYNTNHSPFLATDSSGNLDSGKYDLTSGYETYHNNRSARFYELISVPGKVDYERFRQIKYDNTLPAKLRYPINIDSLWTMNPSDYSSVADILESFLQWDKSSDSTSIGAASFLLLYHYVSGKNAQWKTDRLSKDQLMETLLYIKRYELQHFGKTNITLGELQKHMRGENVYPSWGLPDVLTAMYSDSLTDGRYKVEAGESYIELVRFPKDSLPVIESINCYGASAKPGSKHYSDQMSLFMQKKTRPMSLRREDVMARAEKIYHPE